jgi:hypothetical protein
VLQCVYLYVTMCVSICYDLSVNNYLYYVIYYIYTKVDVNTPAVSSNWVGNLQYTKVIYKGVYNFFIYILRYDLSKRLTELTQRDHEIDVELNFRDMMQTEFPCGQMHLSTSRSSCFNETTICNLLWPGFMWIIRWNIVWAWSSFHEIVAYPSDIITDMSTLLKKEIYNAVCFVDDSCRIKMS